MKRLIVNVSVYAIITVIVFVSDVFQVDELQMLACVAVWVLILWGIQNLFDSSNIVTSPITHHIIASVAFYIMSGALISVGLICTGVVAALVRLATNGQRAINK